MPCFHPLQANFSIRADGKKDISFSSAVAKLFEKGIRPVGSNNLSIPCGKCMGCRLERSRQWAVRIMHEAQMHECNCFVTLTFDDEHLPKDGSLDRKVIQNFMKRLRQKFCDRKVSVFYCGEYGERLMRPHFHLCLFNIDFIDKVYFKSVNGCKYYTSGLLSDLWPFGFSTIGALTFESAAYVARYCVKKINGKEAEKHYAGKTPEFCQASLKPAIGRSWIERYGKSDVFFHDEVIVRGVSCKPPRYYDKYLEKVDPKAFERVKQVRLESSLENADDNTFDRLLVKEKCQIKAMSKLVRTMEKCYDS